MSLLIRKMIRNGCQGANSNSDLSTVRAPLDTAHARCADVPEVQVCQVGRSQAAPYKVTGPYERVNARIAPQPVSSDHCRADLARF